MRANRVLRAVCGTYRGVSSRTVGFPKLGCKQSCSTGGAHHGPCAERLLWPLCTRYVEGDERQTSTASSLSTFAFYRLHFGRSLAR